MPEQTIHTSGAHFDDPADDHELDNDLEIGEAELDPDWLAELGPDEVSSPRFMDEKAMLAHTRRFPGGAAREDGEITIYEMLLQYGMLKKMTDIVMAKVDMPWHLRGDATQEVHTAWLSRKAKPEFVRNQLANYAYMSGKHAALKLRRTIGAVVVIPGQLFRTGRDTEFMQNIGAAVNPKDVDDFKDSMELSVDPMDLSRMTCVSKQFLDDRLAGLTLSVKQRAVAYKAMVERKSAEDIAIELEMQLMYVERLLNQVANKLLNKDAAGDAPGEPAANKPKAPRRRTKSSVSRTPRRTTNPGSTLQP